MALVSDWQASKVTRQPGRAGWGWPGQPGPGRAGRTPTVLTAAVPVLVAAQEKACSLN